MPIKYEIIRRNLEKRGPYEIRYIERKKEKTTYYAQNTDDNRSKKFFSAIDKKCFT